MLAFGGWGGWRGGAWPARRLGSRGPLELGAPSESRGDGRPGSARGLPRLPRPRAPRWRQGRVPAKEGQGGLKAVGVGTRTRAPQPPVPPVPPVPPAGSPEERERSAHLRPPAGSAEGRGGRERRARVSQAAPRGGLGAPRPERRGRGGERSSGCGRRPRPPAHLSSCFSGSDFSSARRKHKFRLPSQEEAPDEGL